MTKELQISVGQHSCAGVKDINQDDLGIHIPPEPLLTSKGIAAAIADGISSSAVSQEASKTAITSFLEDYYSTSEAWGVKKSALCVIKAINSWLYAQTQKSEFRFNMNRGYVCTFSGLIIKSSTAYIVHAGDSRIDKFNGSDLETLTTAHRIEVSSSESYLKRALGMDSALEVDYSETSLAVDDTLLLTTDGIYEFVSNKQIRQILLEYTDDLDQTAKALVDAARDNGSDDNLSVQIVRIDELPRKEANELFRDLHQLPYPPSMAPGIEFDGYSIVRKIYTSARSHVAIALCKETSEQLVIKVPAVEKRDDPGFIERFLLEDWIARRINSPNVLKPFSHRNEIKYIYTTSEYIEGQTLAQWISDNDCPDIETVRDIIEQIASGLRAMHRLEMLHQDLRPENIMIDTQGTVKIIDFGATRVAGLEEMGMLEDENILGTALFSAPEYFLGEFGTERSDQFSLAVIAYHMLSGELPYGTNVAKTRTKKAQNRLSYRSVLHEDREIPAFVDFALQKALHPNPDKRYEEISEFLVDLRTPSRAFINKGRPPLIERDPAAFWRFTSLILALIILFLLVK